MVTRIDVVSGNRGGNMTVITTERKMVANSSCFQELQFTNNSFCGPEYTLVLRHGKSHNSL